MRLISATTRKRLESIIERLQTGNDVNLTERIELSKFSSRIPFISSKLDSALRQRQYLEDNNLI